MLLWHDIRILSGLLYLVSFYQKCASVPCGEGRKKKHMSTSECENCKPDQYQDKPSADECTPCIVCNEGSVVLLECTPFKNTKCQCRDGFSSRIKSNSNCKCDLGSGLFTPGICRKCENGSFTDTINAKCQKWRECGQSGVKSRGNSTSNVICNNDSQHLQSIYHLPKEVTSRSTLPTAATTSYLSSSQVQVVSTTWSLPKPTTKTTDSSKSNNSVIPYIIVFILLILFIAVMCKLAVIPCIQAHKNPILRPGTVSVPIEECGESTEKSFNSQDTSTSGEP